MIERIAELVNADANLVRRGRFLSTTFLIDVGDQGYLVSIIEGRIVSVTPGPFVTPNYSFALRAPRDEWEMFWSKLPPPGSQRHLRAVQARQACASRATCIRSWRTCSTSRTCSQPAPGAAKRRRRAIEPALRADHRPLSQSRAARPPAPALYRGGRPGHSAAVPAHRRLRRAAVPRPAQRPAHHRRTIASSCSTCRGTASRRRRRAGRTRSTGSPRATTCG